MLKSGKELKVFTISEEHLKQFATEAKRYGVVYCALRGKEKSADGMVDVMVRAEDIENQPHCGEVPPCYGGYSVHQA